MVTSLQPPFVRTVVRLANALAGPKRATSAKIYFGLGCFLIALTAIGFTVAPAKRDFAQLETFAFGILFVLRGRS